MRRTPPKPAWLMFPLLALALAGAGFGIQRHAAFHTTPDKWDKPRHFHELFDREYEKRLPLSHAETPSAPKLQMHSPNGAYWVGAEPTNLLERTTSHPQAAR